METVMLFLRSRSVVRSEAECWLFLCTSLRMFISFPIIDLISKKCWKVRKLANYGCVLTVELKVDDRVTRANINSMSLLSVKRPRKPTLNANRGGRSSGPKRQARGPQSH